MAQNSVELVDISMHESDWKAFRKTASQDELLLMAIGSKYRVGTYKKKAAIFALGLVASVGAGVGLIFGGMMDIGLIVLAVGYLLFSFLSSKYIRYQDTYSQLCRRLTGDYKVAIKQAMPQYKVGGFLSTLLNLVLIYITIPYQAIMMMLGMIAPNFVAAKNGILVSVPPGCGLDDILGIYGYFKSASFFDGVDFLLNDVEQTSYEHNHKYEVDITNDAGCRVTLHSADNRTFYDDNNNAYESDDGGRTVRKL